MERFSGQFLINRFYGHYHLHDYLLVVEHPQALFNGNFPAVRPASHKYNSIRFPTDSLSSIFPNLFLVHFSLLRGPRRPLIWLTNSIYQVEQPFTDSRKLRRSQGPSRLRICELVALTKSSEAELTHRAAWTSAVRETPV